MCSKNELENYRGIEIEEFLINPLDIPCRETSDIEQLCKHPVVSVHMITYNQECYIREAVEGVMAQKTDFEFELLLGEDCSQDRTREICFELQKKYPDKIRVLWADENVYKIGGSAARLYPRCRGEYIAFCEGDDYWSDPLKLQKQVDAMQANPSVGLCFARAKIISQAKGSEKIWDRNNRIPHGLIKGCDFFKWHTFDRAVNAPGEDIAFLMTATIMVRKSTLNRIRAEYNLFKWKLMLGDSTIWLGLATISDVYYLPDIVSVYRFNDGGVCSRAPMAVCRDAQIARLYWIKVIGVDSSWPMGFFYGRLFSCRLRAVLEANPSRRVADALTIRQLPEYQYTFGTFRLFVWMNSQWWIPAELLMKVVAWLSLIRRRLFSDMSK